MQKGYGAVIETTSILGKNLNKEFPDSPFIKGDCVRCDINKACEDNSTGCLDSGWVIDIENNNSCKLP